MRRFTKLLLASASLLAVVGAVPTNDIVNAQDTERYSLEMYDGTYISQGQYYFVTETSIIDEVFKISLDERYDFFVELINNETKIEPSENQAHFTYTIDNNKFMSQDNSSEKKVDDVLVYSKKEPIIQIDSHRAYGDEPFFLLFDKEHMYELALYELSPFTYVNVNIYSNESEESVNNLLEENNINTEFPKIGEANEEL